MKSFLILFIAVSIFSCSSQRKLEKKQQKEAILNSWIGQHKSKLIQAWGNPTRYEDDGDGGKIMVYYNFSNSEWTGFQINFVEMFIHADGIIYHWRYGSK